MNTPNPATNAPATSDRYQRHTALSDLYERCDGPGDLSGGLDRLVDAAKAARDAYDDLDYAADIRNSATWELLRTARDAAYETWQGIERGGLPLLQAWQRETLGYSEEEVTK